MKHRFITTNIINNSIKQDAAGYIKHCETMYQKAISEAAEKIYRDRFTHPLVLISGPSGSGKTTSAMYLAALLKGKGLNVHTISMDNYFLPNDMGGLPLDKYGNVDLESPYRLDIPLFSTHLNKLFKCEPIKIPTFDFKTQMRSDYTTICRKEDEIIIVEGIHALNHEVTGDTNDFTTCIYVSVRSRVHSYVGTVMHPRNIRLMRRLSRDCLFRNRMPDNVFEMYESVTVGEEKYIMPHKHRANFIIDTFIPYELSVYANLILPRLEELSMKYKNTKNYITINKILSEIEPISANLVPEDSLIREFIGNSL